MKITLHLDGEERTFHGGFITARMLRKTIEVAKTVNFNDISPDELDVLVGYLVELFGRQFSVDDLYDGVPAATLIPTLIRCIEEVVGGLSSATEGKNQ